MPYIIYNNDNGNSTYNMYYKDKKYYSYSYWTADIKEAYRFSSYVDAEKALIGLYKYSEIQNILYNMNDYLK